MVDILYNVTIIIDHSVHDEWKSWMINVHIPEVMQCNIFRNCKMTKILEDHNEDGVTYAIQYRCHGLEAFNDYQNKFAPRLQAETQNKYGGKYAAFRTCMEIIEEWER
jgi:hypothetical protein